MVEFWIFVGFGAMTGLLAGLLGIGGGVISVPAIYFVLNWIGFPQNELMHVAVATSLTATMITSFGASLAHHQKKMIRFDVLKPICFGLLLGCVSGAFLTYRLDNNLLRYIFGAAILPLSVYFFFPKLPSPHFAPSPNRTLGIWSLLVGCLSTLLGVGGGIFLIPILLGYCLPMKQTIATSSASTLVSSFLGASAFLLMGLHQPSLPMTLGYIYLPALLGFGLGSLPMTKLGAKLAHSLPVVWIKKIFAIALAATGFVMLCSF